jgi:hypothetical protein
MKRNRKLRKPRGQKKTGASRSQQTVRGSAKQGGPQPPKPMAHGLPPNEKLRKFADEIYGDTEIPERKSES